MRFIIRLFAVLSLLTAGLGLHAQEDGYDVFVPISKYIAQGNAEALSAWFDSTLEVTILSKGADASHARTSKYPWSCPDSRSIQE